LFPSFPCGFLLPCLFLFYGPTEHPLAWSRLITPSVKTPKRFRSTLSPLLTICRVPALAGRSGSVTGYPEGFPFLSLTLPLSLPGLGLSKEAREEVLMYLFWFPFFLIVILCPQCSSVAAIISETPLRCHSHYDCPPGDGFYMESAYGPIPSPPPLPQQKAVYVLSMLPVKCLQEFLSAPPPLDLPETHCSAATIVTRTSFWAWPLIPLPPFLAFLPFFVMETLNLLLLFFFPAPILVFFFLFISPSPPFFFRFVSEDFFHQKLPAAHPRYMKKFWLSPSPRSP